MNLGITYDPWEGPLGGIYFTGAQLREAQTLGEPEMSLRTRAATILLTAVASLLAATPALSTCWICLWDGGVEQFYCQSVSGYAESHCVPQAGMYCDISQTSYCEVDGCYCARYPALPSDGTPGVPTRNTIGMLLFQGSSPGAQARMISSLSEQPVAFALSDEIATPEICARAIASHSSGLDWSDLELAGYSAVTKRGPVANRLLGEDDQGVVADCRPSRHGQHLRVAQLVAASAVTSYHEIEVAPNQAALCLMSVGGRSYACVIWALSNDGVEGGAADIQRRFTEAADAFSARNGALLHGDSPKLSQFEFGRGRSVDSPWGSIAAFYR